MGLPAACLPPPLHLGGARPSFHCSSLQGLHAPAVLATQPRAPGAAGTGVGGLRAAVLAGDVAAAKRLLLINSSSEVVELRDAAGCTALLHAAATGNLGMVQVRCARCALGALRPPLLRFSILCLSHSKPGSMQLE